MPNWSFYKKKEKIGNITLLLSERWEILYRDFHVIYTLVFQVIIIINISSISQVYQRIW